MINPQFSRQIKALKLFISVLAALFFININVSALENTFTLPEPKGIYGVGTVNVELSDPTRMQLRGLDRRRWMATVFYPTIKQR